MRARATHDPESNGDGSFLCYLPFLISIVRTQRNITACHARIYTCLESRDTLWLAMDYPHMLLAGHRSNSLIGASEPLSLFPKITSRPRGTTAMPSRPPKSVSPRRRALTDLHESPIFAAQRSKSEANISSLPSLHRLHSSSSDLLLRPLSRETRSSGASVYQEERPERPASSFFTKSSRLLSSRKKSKLDLMSARTEEWLEDTDDVKNTRDVQELSKRRKSKHSRTESAEYGTSNGSRVWLPNY